MTFANSYSPENENGIEKLSLHYFYKINVNTANDEVI